MWISSGIAGEVWGVNSAHEIFQRTGISEQYPSGTGWRKDESVSSLIQLSAFDDQVWGVDGNDIIWQRMVSSHPRPLHRAA